MNNNFVKKVATEGMVLLKNDENILPLKKEDVISFVGKGIFDYHKGGLGSANVMSKYVISITDGIKEKGVKICENSLNEKEEYTVDTLNEFSKSSDIALIGISRLSTEGSDRPVSDYYLSEEESKLFEMLDKSDFEKAVVILNTGSLVDLTKIISHKKVKAILNVWQPGMDGGSAVADVLYGDATPSGRLTDTIASDYYDYPSSKYFDISEERIYYCEDIFVGYRYFETFAKDKVLYPFGYGLSYTKFKSEILSFNANDTKISLEIKVTNTGNYSGKDVLQIYFSAPKGDILKSSIELCSYKKTKTLLPNESKIVNIEFETRKMAYFNEKTASYTLDKGEYKIYLGKNVRELTLCGTYSLKDDKITEQYDLKFTSGVPYQVSKNGEFLKTNIFNTVNEKTQRIGICDSADSEKPPLNKLCEEAKNEYNLYDVSNGKISLDEFISTLTHDQLLSLTQGQPAAFPRGTAGIGNIPELGIANPQTADGPAGVRRTKPTTCFPCATLLACTWNEKLLEEIGTVMGDECVENGVDILLAPGLNIHRNPLCGRNFEYYSEDPIIAGKTASAIVKGVQSKGIGATIKHFALNNKENNRYSHSSEASERAIREIYLKGFEIAIKESNPWCVMTSYNKLNSMHTSANYNLLTGVLREEWGYDGMVMTDWITETHLYEELLAGNNVKMPYGYDDEIELTKRIFKQSDATRTLLEKNAYYILKLVMKTRRFKNKNFGTLHNIDENSIKATDFAGVSNTWAGNGYFESGEEYLFGIGLQQVLKPFVYYRITSEKGGKYNFNMRLSCAYEGVSIELHIDGKEICEIPIEVSEYNLDKPFEIKYENIEINKGEHELKLYTKGNRDIDSVHIEKIFFQKI